MTSTTFAGLAEREDVKTVHIHQLALDTIQAMLRHTEQVGEHFGRQSPEYIAEAKSLHQVLGQIFSFGFATRQYITRDGELSLYVNEGDVFVFGVIFFRNRDFDPQAGQIPAQPGTWSCHS